MYRGDCRMQYTARDCRLAAGCVEKGFRDEIWNAQAELAAKLSRENVLETLCPA